MGIREMVGSWLVKAKSFGGTVLGVGEALPSWTNWDARAAVKDGYKSSVWVYACIRRKTTQSSSVPWRVEVMKNGEWVESDGHPLEDLLKQPNPFMSWQDMIDLYFVYMDLTGAYYLGENKAGDSMELWPIPSHKLSPRLTKTDGIAYYEYMNEGELRKIDPGDIIYHHYPDPTEPLLPLAPLQAAARTVDTDIEAVKWNKYSLENRTVTDTAFVSNEKMSATEFSRFKDLLKEEYMSSKNARKPFVLGNFDAKNLSMSPVEMDFIESRKMTRIEICAAMDVPPMLVGIPDTQSYSNYETAEKSFWLNTIIPNLKKFRDTVNASIKDFYGDGVRLNYDLSSVPALNEDVNELHKRIREDYAAGLITQNEGRVETGREELPDGDFYLTPVRSVQTRQRESDQEDDEKGSKAVKHKAFNLESEEQKTLYWKAFERRRERFYDAVAEKITKRFKDEKAEVLKGLKDGNVSVESVIEGQEDEWRKLLKAIYFSVIEEFGKETFDGLKSSYHIRETKETIFDAFLTNVLQFVESVTGFKITNILETTVLKVRKEVTEGISNGESIPKIADRIEQTYEGFEGYRSTLIARTEVIAASNAGSRFGAKQTGLPLEKEWIATRDKRTRRGHKRVDGEIRDVDEPYSNGLMYPGDPNGAASQVIQCRCTEAYKVKDTT